MHDQFTIEVTQKRGRFKRNEVFLVSGPSEGEAISFALARIHPLSGADEPVAEVIGRTTLEVPR